MWWPKLRRPTLFGMVIAEKRLRQRPVIGNPPVQAIGKAGQPGRFDRDPRSDMIYAKRPFAGPGTVLAYLSRYTHRVALSNRRLIAADSHGVTFTYKDYKREGRDRYRTMTLGPHEFIRRFLIHVLPKGFHRIRHYGLFASAERRHNIAQLRQVLAVPAPKPEVDDVEDKAAASKPLAPACPCCGGRMVIIETFARGATPRHRPTTPIRRLRIDTS